MIMTMFILTDVAYRSQLQNLGERYQKHEANPSRQHHDSRS